MAVLLTMTGQTGSLTPPTHPKTHYYMDSTDLYHTHDSIVPITQTNDNVNISPYSSSYRSLDSMRFPHKPMTILSFPRSSYPIQDSTRTSPHPCIHNSTQYPSPLSLLHVIQFGGEAGLRQGRGRGVAGQGKSRVTVRSSGVCLASASAPAAYIIRVSLSFCQHRGAASLSCLYYPSLPGLLTFVRRARVCPPPFPSLSAALERKR